MSRAQAERKAHFDCSTSSETSKRIITTASTDSIPTHPGDEKFPRQPSWSSILAFTTKAQAPLLCASVLAAIAAGAAAPVYNIFFGKVLDSFTDYAAGRTDGPVLQHNISFDSGIIVVIGAANWLLNAIFLSLWMGFGEIQARSCRQYLFESLLGRPIAWYDTREDGVGVLMPRIQSQILELKTASSQPLGSLFRSVSACITALAIAFYYCWSLTLVVLPFWPLSALLLALLSSRSQQDISSQETELVAASKYAIAAIQSIEMVKCFNSQDCEAGRYIDAIKRAARFYHRQAKTFAMQIGFARFASLLMFTVGFWYGSHLVITGRQTTANIVTAIFSALSATGALQSVLPYLSLIEKGKVAGASLTAMVDPLESEDTGARPSCHIPAACCGSIDFIDVDFSYPSRPDYMSLSTVTCSFPAGSTTFVIGKSGSGKSTLAQLLLRFYEPSAGAVLLDGIPLAKFDLHWLRQNIMVVEQQATLFDGTLSENIGAMRCNPNSFALQDIKEAVEFALLRNTVNDLTDGLDTRIEALATNFSGGQRQRIALARARLRDSPVVIFDESLSALDQISRSLMLAAIRQWRRGRTTIFISHDISQIEQHDFVCIFEHGRLVEQGCRTDLDKQPDAVFQQYQHQEPNITTTSTTSKSRSRPLSYTTVSSADTNRHEYVSTIQRTLSAKVKALAKPSHSSNVPLTFSPSLGGRGFEPLSFGISPLLQNPVFGGQLEMEQAINRTTSNNSSEHNRTSNSATHASSSWNRYSKDSYMLAHYAGIQAVENRASPARHKRRALECHQFEMNDHETRSPTAGSRSLKSILLTVWPELNKRSRITLIAGLVTSSVYAGAIPTFAWLVTKLLATLTVSENSSHSAAMWSAAIIGVAVLDGVTACASQICLEGCAQTWIDGIRSSAMKCILSQPRQFFAQQTSAPTQLAQTLWRDAEEMRSLLGRFTAFGLQAILLLIIAMSWSFTSCWQLALVSIGIIPLPALSTLCFQRVSSVFETKSNDASKTVADILSETCINIKTVRALTLEPHFLCKHTEACALAFNIGIRRAIASGFFYGLTEATPDFYNALLYYAGARLVASGHCTVAQSLTVFTMLLFSIANIGGIVTFLPQINSAKASASRLLHLAHDLPPISHEDTGNVRIHDIGDIELQNLSFAYPSRPQERVLHNINIDFPIGTTTALVGLSGSGKSTIAALLLRMYELDPTGKHGRITIAGRSLHRLHTPTLRSLIAVVPQTCVLIPGTVAENIRYGLQDSDPLASMPSIRSAAEASGIHEFITSLPSGYDTLIGAGGTTLSGGQTQRLGIARALIRRPRLLILDESTSALDPVAAGVVAETVGRLVERSRSGALRRGLAGGLTVVVITHTKEMMMVAERIVMLEGGRVVDRGGGYAEMVRRGGRFAELMRGGVWVGGGNG